MSITTYAEFQYRQEQRDQEKARRVAERICEQQWDDFHQTMFDSHIRPLFENNDPEDAA